MRHETEPDRDAPGEIVLPHGGGMAADPVALEARRPSDRQAAEPRPTGGDWTDGDSRSGRTVLIYASRFPPDAAVGAIRIRKFAKYLSTFGWRPVVITGPMPNAAAAGSRSDRKLDHGGLDDLPATLPVHRLDDSTDQRPERVAEHLAAVTAALTAGIGSSRSIWAERFAWRLRSVQNKLSFPDRNIWRLPQAVSLAVRLHRQYRFDAIFTSGMPFSDHVVGLALQSVLRRPWLVDFRDPWVEYIHWPKRPTAWERRLTAWTERAVVRRATRTINVNPSLTRRFAERYPELPVRKFVTIENGFDPSDFPARSVAAPRRRFRMLYAGSLYGARSPATLMSAFRDFIASVPGSATHACFDFAGRPGHHLDALHTANDGETTRYLGHLTHRAALRAMSEADVNVVILPNVPGGEYDTTAKIYECLGSGRPVLAAVPREGAAADVLRGHDGVVVCDPDDSADMRRAITDLYRRWLGGALAANRSTLSLARLTRRHQTGLLAGCLDRVVGRSIHDNGGTA